MGIDGESIWMLRAVVSANDGIRWLVGDGGDVGIGQLVHLKQMKRIHCEDCKWLVQIVKG